MNEYGIYIALDHVGLGYLTVKRFIVFSERHFNICPLPTNLTIICASCCVWSCSRRRWVSFHSSEWHSDYCSL